MATKDEVGVELSLNVDGLSEEFKVKSEELTSPAETFSKGWEMRGEG